MNQAHPITFIESFLSKNKRISEVQLSVYRYHAESLLDDCTVYKVATAQLRTKYEQLVSKLDQQQDLAFDSVVTVGKKLGVKRHLPLIDFQSADAALVEIAAEQLVNEHRPPQAALVHSGRSYHFYMGKLLSHGEWVKFMGRALLLNARNEPPTIDTRWIGHRLIAGYGALRWSAKLSPQLPTIIRQW